jgi:S1-C subfamily serine protease
MNGLHDDEIEIMAQNIVRLSDYLYADPREDNLVELTDVIRAFPQLCGAEVEQLLRRLDDSGIVEFDDRRQIIRLVPDGRLFQEQKCVPEVVLGLNYSDMRFSKAVVRIVVRKVNGDEGAGSGFFIADPPNLVITNRHVASNEIVQIEDLNNRVIFRGDPPKTLGPEDLDLAAITCQIPAEVVPIRIDWNHESARHLDPVLVFGYPYVANHEPALFHAEGTISMIARRLGPVVRSSLIISDAAARGCSGGPVLSATGRAIGIVAREEEAQAEGNRNLVFLSAIPSYYLQEVVPR